MPFENQSQITARALYIGQRIDLKTFEKTQYLATSPLMLRAGRDGAVVLFRYGVVVIFGLNAIEEAAFLHDIRPFVANPMNDYEYEEIVLGLASSSSGQIVHLDDFEPPRLQIVADVLAKSVILAYYEKAVAQTFDRIEPLASKIQQGGNFMPQGRELLKHIGDVLLIQGKMVGRVEVGEKPELLWEEPRYDRLYLKLAHEYELLDRHRALEQKLELISRTAETLLDLLQNKRSLRVEWYIVILIVIEIILSLYGMLR